MWRIPVVVALVFATVLLGARPARAHGVAGVQPTNYETRILAVEPPVDGLEVRPVDLGESIELRNTTDEQVLVLGYVGEPYLRVGPEGVFENRASPSWAVNVEPEGSIPEEVGDDTPPRWVRVGGGTTVRWHDHRAHWMGSEPPASVREDPGSEHRVLAFEIELSHGDTPVTVAGEVVWRPGPSPWPWVVAAIVLAGIVLALSRTGSWALVLGLALGLLVATEAVHVAGVWGATTAATTTKLAAIGYSLLAIAVGTVALVWLARARDPYDATPVVLLAGLLLAISGGLADVTTLARSQLPTTLPPDLARAAVTVALGLGIGITAAAALRIRRPAAAATRSP